MERKLESEIQAAIIRQYEQQGYLVVKIGLCNKQGFPDLMVMKAGKILFIEVKRPGEKPRPLQEYRHRKLKEQGFEIITLNE